MTKELLKYKPEIKECKIEFVKDFINVYWDDTLIITNNREIINTEDFSYNFYYGLEQKIQDGETLPKTINVKKESNWFETCPSGKYWEDEPHVQKSNSSIGDFSYNIEIPDDWFRKEKKNWVKEEVLELCKNAFNSINKDFTFEKWAQENIQKYEI